MKLLSAASDQELVQLFLKGNNNAFEVLVRRYKAQLFYTIFCVVHDKYITEDLLQEVYFKIVKSIRLGNYNEEGRFLPWANRIAANLSLDYLRRVKRQPRFVDEEKALVRTTQATDCCEQKMIQLQTNTYLSEALDHLPEEQRRVIFFRHFEEMSFKEIAQITNTSVSTAIGRLRYGLINLRRIMDQRQALFAR